MSGSGSGSSSIKPPPRKKPTAAFKKGLAKITQNEERIKELRAEALESKFFDSSAPQTRKSPFESMSHLQLPTSLHESYISLEELRMLI